VNNKKAKTKLRIIKILLGMNLTDNINNLSIREIKITNKKNFMDKKISTDNNKLFNH
jgi:hypothetical protein